MTRQGIREPRSRARTQARATALLLAVAAACLALAAGTAAAAFDDNPATQPTVTQPGPPAIKVGNPDADRPGAPVRVLPASQALETGRYDVVVSATVTVSESGTLSIAVRDRDGSSLILNGRATSVDGNLVGAAQARAYTYRIVRPRTVMLEVSIPARQVEAREKLQLVLGFTDQDASRKRSSVTVPVRAPASVALPPITRVLVPTTRQVERIRQAIAVAGRAVVTVRAASPGATSVTIRWGGLTSTSGSLTRVIRSIGQLDPAAGVTADGLGITGRFTVAD